MRFKTTTYGFLAAFIALLATPAHVVAQPAAKAHRSFFTVFDVPGTGLLTIPTAINLGGTITGYDFDTNTGAFHGFIRTPGGHITTFDPPGAGTTPYSGSQALAINLVGEVTGQFAGDDLMCHGFIRRPGGHFVTFDAPGASPDCNQGGTLGAAINLFGQVGGYYVDANNVYHGFLRAADGTFTIIDAPGAGTGAYQGTWMNFITSITLDGSLTGSYSDASGLVHGWVRKGNGTITTFDVPGAGTDGSQGQGTYPAIINELGEVGGGYFDEANSEHPFLRAPDGTITTLDIPGASDSGVEELNVFGIAAGELIDQGTYRSFVRALDGTITIFDAPGATGGTYANGINDLGVITGTFVDQNGQHGFIRSPHP